MNQKLTRNRNASHFKPPRFAFGTRTCPALMARTLRFRIKQVTAAVLTISHFFWMRESSISCEAPIDERFTEGFATHDLQAVAQLLRELDRTSSRAAV